MAVCHDQRGCIGLRARKRRRKIGKRGLHLLRVGPGSRVADLIVITHLRGLIAGAIRASGELSMDVTSRCP